MIHAGLESDCHDGNYYLRADPSSCEHYYTCKVWGEAVRTACPDGTQWSSITHACAYPPDSDCASGKR